MRLTGLVSAQHYNGRAGFIAEALDFGRYSVRLTQGHTLLVKEGNLERLHDSHALDVAMEMEWAKVRGPSVATSEAEELERLERAREYARQARLEAQARRREREEAAARSRDAAEELGRAALAKKAEEERRRRQTQAEQQMKQRMEDEHRKRKDAPAVDATSDQVGARTRYCSGRNASTK